MKIDTIASSGRTRSYDNTFREEQARQTRRRIIETAMEVLATGGEGVTLAQVARAAGVSEPTLYRHFGSRERLFEEIDLHAQAHLGLPVFPLPEGIDGIGEQLRTLFQRFEEHGSLLRALMRTGLGKELRNTGRARRTRQLRELIEALAPQLDSEEITRAVATVRVLVSWESFEALTGDLGLSVDAASDAVTWAVETLLREATAQEKPRGGRKPAGRPRSPGRGRRKGEGR